MASAKKITPPPVVQPPPSYQLTLTEDEALVLALMTFNTCSPDGQAGDIFEALRAAGLSLTAAQEKYTVHGPMLAIKAIR